MRWTTFTLVMGLACAAATACAPQPHVSISSENWVQTELFFGLSSPSGLISDAEFGAFLDNAVTPGFPDGYTVLPAQGRWKGASEPCRLLLVLHPDSPAIDSAINELRAEYKRRFHQQSVLRADASARVRF